MFSFQGASSSKSNPHRSVSSKLKTSPVSLFLLSNQNPLTLGFWLVLGPFSRDSMKHHLSMLLQSISFKKWWAKMDSNHRPHDYQSCALASWAIGPYLVEIKSTIFGFKLRLKPQAVSLFLLSESNPLRWALLRYLFFWWRVPGSNRWPPACKAGALPAELTPQIQGF